MPNYLEAFQQGIIERRKIKIIMQRKNKPKPLLATCAPLDYGPKNSAPDGGAYFHVYKYSYRGTAEHLMAIEPEMLTRLELIEELFDPADIITWDVRKKPWTYPRDWGDYS